MVGVDLAGCWWEEAGNLFLAKGPFEREPHAGVRREVWHGVGDHRVDQCGHWHRGKVVVQRARRGVWIAALCVRDGSGVHPRRACGCIRGEHLRDLEVGRQERGHDLWLYVKVPSEQEGFAILSHTVKDLMKEGGLFTSYGLGAKAGAIHRGHEKFSQVGCMQIPAIILPGMISLGNMQKDTWRRQRMAVPPECADV